MDRKGLIARALAKAEKYYGFTRWIGDQETVQRILELTAKLRRRARAIARPT
jgi:endo-beta-N-acetylglucosaminidase D